MGAFELKWGILSTGGIAAVFAKDLLVDPATRDVSDVRHRIVAVASRSRDNATRFIEEHLKADKTIEALGSYDELYRSEKVDILYIATPHSHHYDNVKAALEHGKHVCVEKPATVNAKQWRALTELAKSEKLFLMEAVWTRFFPLVHHYQDLIQRGIIGQVEYIYAELCIQRELYGPKGTVNARFVDPKLAAGALLDEGPYPLLHTLLAAPRSSAEMPRISSSMIKMLPKATEPFGGGEADETTLATLEFLREDGRKTVAQIMASLTYHTPHDRAVTITGTKGRLVIPFPPYRPVKLVIEACETEAEWRDDKTPSIKETKDFEIPGGAHGMIWEADECARCIRDGKLESETISWQETALTMEIFDEIRQQNNLRFPEEIEKL